MKIETMFYGREGLPMWVDCHSTGRTKIIITGEDGRQAILEANTGRDGDTGFSFRVRAQDDAAGPAEPAEPAGTALQ